jgi:phosphoribosylformylglycinamidine synthase
MPHPEHAIEELCGPSADGLGFFTSLGAAGLLSA